MSRSAIVSPEGLRVDGRRPPELRRLVVDVAPYHPGHPIADGSARYEQGNTVVSATIYGPREITALAHRGEGEDRDTCVIIVDYNYDDQHQHNINNRQSKHRLIESSMIIKQSYEAIIMTHLLPRSQITICIRIINDDGGALCCAVNASTLALMNAGIPMKSTLIAIQIATIHTDTHQQRNLNNNPAVTSNITYPTSSSIISQPSSSSSSIIILCDPSHQENLGSNPQLSIGLSLSGSNEHSTMMDMNDSSDILLLSKQSQSESLTSLDSRISFLLSSGRFPISDLSAVFLAARSACREIQKIILVALKEYNQQILKTRGMNQL